MTSIDSARFPSYETTPRGYETRSYDAGIPARRGALFSALDKIGLSLATLMALGPLAATAWGSYFGGA